VPTDTSPSRTRTAEFLLRASAWSVGIFGLLRLGWIESHALLQLTQWQGSLAAALCGQPARPIAATLACSGADVVAICAGTILAYPARWPARLLGAGTGVALILSLNTLRIGTLGRLAASPAVFDAFHVYLWPAFLSLAVAGYVFGWMRRASRRVSTEPHPLPATVPAPSGVESRSLGSAGRFALLAAALLLLFTAAAPLYLESTRLLGVAGFIARAAAWTLQLLGIEARATANQLWTARGSYLVTQECISTPLIPIYLAAVLALRGPWRSRLLAICAAVPLFVGLGIARLLVVALPPSLAASPLFLIHAFFQILLAAVVVVLAAIRRHADRWTAARRALCGIGLGAAFVLLLGAPCADLAVRATRALGAAAGPAPDDPQGAIALLPGFQAGLYLALWVAARVTGSWRRFVAGLALLGLLQIATLAALPLLAGSLSAALLTQGVRAWAVAAPLIVLALVNRLHAPVGNAQQAGTAYRRFWQQTGQSFPDLAGATSTSYYAQNERRLFAEHFPPLPGLRLLKTDLWDEARNTRILAWAAGQGACAFGVDISPPIVEQARRAFVGEPLCAAVADVRALPFADASFDAVYSMGTVEHFRDSARAIDEMVRVLRPGGTAIIGVPNRHDPFLRPLLAAGLQALGLYSYGYEKSFSRRELRRMIEAAGLAVRAETAILFIPGWLRMLDLACHVWCRPLAALTGALVWPFAFLDRRLPAVRRHGYLLATVAVKPAP
jgi:exosortase/archaeosortase family protein